MLSSIITHNYSTPYGEVIIGSYDDLLCLCDWRWRNKRELIDLRLQKGLQAEFKEGQSLVIDKTILQLNQYFTRERESFDLPLLLVGTDFQKKVWNALSAIPYGKTISYLQLSEKLGNTQAIRVVASANGANAISIIIPCHRVIGADGKLVGYAGGLKAKKGLLELENKIKQQSLFSS